MARWSDLAVWVGPTVNQGPGMNEYRGLVLHIAQGSYEGTISWQKNPAADVSSHFIVAEDGRCAQMVDTATAAWTQADGNGEWLSVEFAGFSGNPLTGPQAEVAAQLYARGVQLHGFPLQAADSPSGRGLGWHGMGGAAWGNHPSCPGEPIKAQRPAILARATEILSGTENDMTWLTDDRQETLFWRVEALQTNKPEVAGGQTKGEPNQLHFVLKDLADRIAKLESGGVDVNALAAALAPLLPKPLTKAETVAAVTEGANIAEDR